MLKFNPLGQLILSTLRGSATGSASDTRVLKTDTDGRLEVVTTNVPADMPFTALRDTPGSYADQAGKLVAVNAGEDALEFVAPLLAPRTRSFFVPAPCGVTLAGDSFVFPQGWLGVPMDTGEWMTAPMIFSMPADCLGDVYAHFIATTNITGTIHYAVNAQWGAIEADRDASSMDTFDAYYTFAYTGRNDIVTTIEFPDLDTPPVAGDIVRLDFQREGTSVADTLAGKIFFSGVFVTYTAAY